MSDSAFTAADESDTVEVTLNGHHWLTDVYIEDGLLRLGADVVQGRVNEAVQKASAKAAMSIAADRELLDEKIAAINDDMSNQPWIT